MFCLFRQLGRVSFSRFIRQTIEDRLYCKYSFDRPLLAPDILTENQRFPDRRPVSGNLPGIRPDAAKPVERRLIHRCCDAG